MVFDSGPIHDTHVYRYDSWGDREVRWHLTQGQTVTGPVGDLLLSHPRAAPHAGLLPAGHGPDGADHRRPEARAEKVIVRTALKGLKERIESAS